MSNQILRNPPNGPEAAEKGTIVIPATAIGASTGATVTASFPGAATGDVAIVSFRAAVGNNASVVFSDVRVSAAGVLTLTFGNTGAAATIVAATIDATLLDF